MAKAIAIGFFNHTVEMPSATDMMKIYNEMISVFDAFDISPTHFLGDDGINSCTFKKFGGAFHQRVLARKIEGFQGLALAAVPQGSKAPGYDRFFSISFSYSPEGEEVSVSLVTREPFLVCGDAKCDDVVRRLAQYWTWDYGFGIQRDVGTDVGVYMVGGGSSRHSAEDLRRGQLWYACYQPEERRKRVRDIFPYNIVGIGHLANALPDGRTLKAFIETDSDSDLRPLTDDLWQWKVKPDRTEAVREKLRGTGIIVAE